MGTDARVRYTKRVIKESFVSLLKTKPINRITVKEICALSQINRATFYKHYRDAYDLLEKLEQSLLEELLLTVGQGTRRGFSETFTLILERLKAEGELYHTLFSDNGDRSFHRRIFPLCYKSSAMERDPRFQRLSPAEQKWLYYFVAQGCSGILDQWISSGMAEPVEEVAAFADRLFQSTAGAF